MNGIWRWFLGILAIFSLALPTPASAHPELIFYIDTSATIHNEGQELRLDYYIAKSEQFSFAELAEVESDLDRYANGECERALSGMILKVGNYQIDFNLQSAAAIERLESTGAGVWVECKYSSPIEFYSEVEFTWADQNFQQTPGYREFNLGLGQSRSKNLTDFSQVAEISSEISMDFKILFPEEVVVEETELTKKVEPEVEVVVKEEVIEAPEIEPAVVEEKVVEKSFIAQLSDRYFRAINPNLVTVLVGTLIAFFLGALHSIAPGHGKSIMAVMALGERGRRSEIVRLGITMGITHTSGVFILGSIFIFGSSYAPTGIIPVLGIISGLLVTAIGLFYLRRFLIHWREHQMGHEHHHHEGEVGGKKIALLGVIGGMVPTPTALTVLVGTAALGSAWYGVLLVSSYGIGMTVVLIFAGRLVENLYRLVEGVADTKRSAKLLFESAPAIAATIQVIAGVFLVAISYGALA
ncbi:MAG: hypothetical protein RLZZ394_487 [Actinomycetota bacterium]